MQFCQVCRNVMYLRAEQRGPGGANANARPVLNCRACGFSRSVDTGVVTVDVFTKALVDASGQYMTPYVEQDPTLPHVTNIPCPNKACTKPPGEASDVIYMKYDQRNMRYVYRCVHCKTFWKHE